MVSDKLPVESNPPQPPRLLDRTRERLRLKHYSLRTETAYLGWIKRFICFHGKRHPADMGKAEVEAFLTHLALDRDVAAALRTWLAAHPEDRTGAKGTIRKSNRTDNASAKVATSKGVIQGYTGVAAVDAQHQIIVEAQAHGTGSEQELLLPMVKATAAYRNDQTLITADAGYHSDTNLTALAAQEIPALIADTGMRQRDERFADQDKYKALPDPLYDEVHPKQGAKHYRPKDTMARNQRSRSAKYELPRLAIGW